MSKVTSEHWAIVRRHFDDLVDLTPHERDERIKTLELEPECLSELRSLFDASEQAGRLDERLKPAVIADPANYSSVAPGTVIADFVIDRLIGRGGMGEVYEAHRDNTEFVQRVALKLLRPEAAGHADLFERERRLLAALEHPGIARLIDGGIAPDRRPYMAMEFVEGQPLTQWCRERKADVPERLRLFREICDAVAHAHGRLIIHRDLKPANILVDTTGRVRLLDFGVAKLADEYAASSTATQSLVTPAYAAPEQLAQQPSTVATDIYALGAILFELLAGKGPWERPIGQTPSILHRMLHEDPPLPSVATSAEGDGMPGRALRGDLDAIVMKAMRRAPEHRFRSVDDLAADVRRHLELQPVLARDGNARYLAGRFLRRNALAVGLSTAAALAIIAGAGGIAWQARQTAVERDLAVAETRRTEAINSALTVMFRDIRQSGAGANATVKDMLAATADRLVDSVDKSAESTALITTIADLYQYVEDPLAAATLLEKAKARGIGMGDPVATAEIDMRLGAGLVLQGKLPEGNRLLDSAWSVFGADRQRYPKQALEVIAGQAQAARVANDLDRAIQLLKNSLPEAERVYADDQRELLVRYNNLIVYLLSSNRIDELVPIYERASAALTRFGQERSELGLAMRQVWAGYLSRKGRIDEAASQLSAIVTDRRATSGKNMGLATDLLQLGRVQLAKGDYAAGIRTLEEGRAIGLGVAGAGAPAVSFLGLSLAEAYYEAGRAADGARLLHECEPFVAAPNKPPLFHGAYYRVRAIGRIEAGQLDAALADVDQAEELFTKAGASAATFIVSIPALRARIAAAQR